MEGGHPLHGSVAVSGAKNAALPACIASLLTDEPVILREVPVLLDVSTILYTLSALGKRVVRNEGSVSIAGGNRLQSEANPYSVRKMRASFLVLGPLLARLGEAVVPLPGGCAIGARPVDLHLEGLRALGAHVVQRDGVVRVVADRLVGAEFSFPFPSVGATEQVLMTACLAQGRTTLRNAAVEPEVLDLIALLQSMGAVIAVEGRTISIDGVRALRGTEHALIPDRMEAGTLLLAGLITGGRVVVSPARVDHMQSFLDTLREMGVQVILDGDTIGVERASRCDAVVVETSPYPGFPTDLHPQLVACLALGRGTSRLREQVFERRFAYTDGLRSMGARLDVQGQQLTVHGVDRFRAQRVEAPDIRGGAALVLAGLAAQGQTTITDVGHIERGHENLVGKLQELGASIERREEPASSSSVVG